MNKPKQRKGLNSVSKSRREAIRKKGLEKRRQRKQQPKEPEILPTTNPDHYGRCVQYDDERVNALHEELQQWCARVGAVSEVINGNENAKKNILAAVVVGYNGLIEWAHNNGITLVEFLTLIEFESQNIIAEMQLLHAQQSKAVN